MTKVTPGENPPGLRVHLPAPFIVGTPTPEGAVAYHVELLPDPDQEYAIATWTFLAKQKVTLNRTIELYLQKADITQDSTAVAKALADATGEVTKTAVNTLVEKKKEEIATNTAADKARRDAITAKMADLASKEALLKKATARLARADQKLRAAIEAGDKDAEKAAKTELDLAAAELENAQIDRDAAEKALEVTKATIFDDPAAQRAKKEGRTPNKKSHQTARGPVMYRIAEDQVTGGIQLIEVPWQLFSFNGQPVQSGGQLAFETQGKKPDAGTTSAPAGKPQPVTAAFTVDTYKEGDQAITVRFTKPVQALHESECKVANVTNGEDAKEKKWVALGMKNGDVVMTWKKETPKGSYTAGLALSFEGVGAHKAAITITVK